MKLQELRESGRLVAAEPVKKTIHWKEYTTLSDDSAEEYDGDIWVRPLSFGNVQRLRSTTDGREHEFAVQLISACVLFDEGREQLTAKDVESLPPGLGNACFLAALEINGMTRNVEGDGGKK